jgi:tripartite-type tricarboxylate transporter receptor subunit TctC
LTAALFATFVAPLAQSQGYPAKPIRLIIPFAAGGGADTNMRQILPEMAKQAQGTFVVDNRPGANGIIAAEMAAKSAPDGYTIFVATNSTHSANPHLYRKLPYDALGDFEPIGMVGQTAPVLLAKANAIASSVRQVVELAKRSPGKLNFAITNTSSLLATEAFKRAAQLNVANIAYKSGPQAATDVVSGHVDFVFGDMATAGGLIKGGRLQPLAVASSRRLAAFPDIPTVAEAGFPGVEVEIWVGLFAPKGTAPEILAILNRALVASLQAETTRSSFAGVGMDARPMTTAEFVRYVRQQHEHWGRMIRDAGIQPE